MRSSRLALALLVALLVAPLSALLVAPRAPCHAARTSSISAAASRRSVLAAAAAAAVCCDASAESLESVVKTIADFEDRNAAGDASKLTPSARVITGGMSGEVKLEMSLAAAPGGANGELKYMWFADQKSGEVLAAKAFRAADAQASPSFSARVAAGKTAVPTLYTSAAGVWEGAPIVADASAAVIGDIKCISLDGSCDSFGGEAVDWEAVDAAIAARRAQAASGAKIVGGKVRMPSLGLDTSALDGSNGGKRWLPSILTN